MFTYKFVTSKWNKLLIRLRSNGVKTELNTQIPMTSEELDATLLSIASKNKGDARKKGVLAGFTAVLNQTMTRFCEEGDYSPNVMTVRKVLEQRLGLIDGSTKGEFVQWFEKFISTKSNPGTKGIYEHTLSRMRVYDPRLDYKKFEEINLAWLEDFETFCAKTASKNARNIHLRNIRAVFNYAIDHDATTLYPFRRFKIQPEATPKRALSVEALRELISYNVEPYQEFYRDMFVLIFMLLGINTVDLHRLKSIENGRVNFKRAKTGRLYSIKVEPEALALIKKYKGSQGLIVAADRWSDHRNFRHQLNKALQSIGTVERKGRGGKKIITSAFPELTSYWARHTWATLAYELGVSKDIISQALGHSSGSDVTEIYIKRNDKKVDEANRRVLDWVLYGKK